MKVHVWLLARAIPAALFAPVVIVAVNTESPGRWFVGTNVAVLPEDVTEPGIGIPFCERVKVLGVIVVESMGLLKVAVISAVRGTFPVPLAGTV
jgi:hypothetical protein